MANFERLSDAKLVTEKITTTTDWVKKINELHKFFEKCPFVESPESRELLLTRLDVIIERWEGSDQTEILRYYDFAVDAR